MRGGRGSAHNVEPPAHPKRVLLLAAMIRAAARSLANLFSGPANAAPPPRQADLDLSPERERPSHEKLGTLLVVLAFLAAIAAAIGFLFVYWTKGNNLLLGGTLAMFLGGLGASLVLYARWLMPDRQAIEPRKETSSDPEERESLDLDFSASTREIRRRGLLTAIGVATVGSVAAMVVSLFRSLGASPDPSIYSTVWKRGQRLVTTEGTPVSVNALEPGNTMIVFPEGSIGDERAQTVLIRVRQGDLHLPQARADWAPMGYVAYSRVCTHAGCSVGLYEVTTQQLMCPCHQSTFDVLRAALPTGGPAARALPQVPLYADSGGILRAAGGFSEPPGPGFWGLS